ncbi:hypothetical protein SOQ14_14135, partial [Erythrobacter sp. T5W1-R]|nr:hypothetical protein [Erythrobacter sp. T5W1-R]
AAACLLRAGRALMLSEEARPDGWMLGEQGAVIAANPGVQAMVRHHRLLYADLADPMALLRQDRREPTHLSRFWTYAGALHGAPAYQQVESVVTCCQLQAHFCRVPLCVLL